MYTVLFKVFGWSVGLFLINYLIFSKDALSDKSFTLLKKKKKKIQINAVLNFLLIKDSW